MKLAIVVSRYSQLPGKVAEVLKKLNLEPKYVGIPDERSRFRVDAKAAFMTAIQEYSLPLEEEMAVVRLDDTDVVKAQGLRSAIIHLTAKMNFSPTVDPLMISFSRGQVVVVKGKQPYPVPD